MADRLSRAGDSTWYWYQLEPADLAVHTRPSEGSGISLVWKGGIDITRLAEYFATAAKQLSRDRAAPCRAWFVTNERARYFDLDLNELVPVSPELAGQASYVRFECSFGGDDRGRPKILGMWSNRDTEASSLDDLQQCVGIQVMPEYLSELEEVISSVATEISSSFFREGYERGAVQQQLVRLRSELPEMSLESAAF